MDNIKIKEAMKIYFALLRNGEIRKTQERELFNLYHSSIDIQEVLNMMVEESECEILITLEAVYLIPKPENRIIGFNYKDNEELKNIDNLMDYYMGLYIITFILNEFFNSIDSVEFISVDRLVKGITKRLDIAAEKDNIKEIEQDIKVNITELRDAWRAKKEVPEDKNAEEGKMTKSMKCRYGCVRKMIVFLRDQGLILYHKEDDEIRPTEKLNDLMNNFFLLNERKCEVESVLYGNGVM